MYSVVFDLVNGAQYANVSNGLIGAGLSPDGSDIVAYSLIDKIGLAIYKLCNSTSYYN